VLLAGREGAGPLAAADIEADAEAVAVTVAGTRLVGAFGAAARMVSHGRQGLFALDSGRGDFSILLTPEGTIADVSLDEPARVRLFASERPGKALLDDEATELDFDGGSRTIMVSLTAGEHTLAYGPDPERAVSHPLHALAVRIGNTEGNLEGYARRRALGLLRNWWGQVEVPKHDRYALEITGISGPEPVVSWDGEDVELSTEDDRATATMWAQTGSHYLMMGTEGEVETVSLAPSGLESAPAKMLPADYKLPDGAVVVEAENVSAEGEVKGRIVEKVGASGGVAHGNWDARGQWAEWKLNVPRAGEYELLIRAATVYDEVVRELLLDGEALPGASIVEFTSTGGWCRTTDDWRYFQVHDAQGEPVVLDLAAGEHVLHMLRLEASMNLDLVALLPCRP
jgi:hypothetical protein